MGQVGGRIGCPFGVGVYRLLGILRIIQSAVGKSGARDHARAWHGYGQPNAFADHGLALID